MLLASVATELTSSHLLLLLLRAKEEKDVSSLAHMKDQELDSKLKN
jgi:hypothetical protein